MGLNQGIDEPLVEILMATYNGERFLVEQIESIRCQSYKNWRLLISDDGSQDSTLKIVKYYADLDSRIEVRYDLPPVHSAALNFFNLLKISQADYVMFSDQDDVWLPDKIELEVEAMHHLEREYDKNLPLLVFTDSAVVDEQLDLLSPSCSSGKEYNSKTITFEQMLCTCVGQGCTMILNKGLCDLMRSCPVDPAFNMHDDRAIILASLYGHFFYLPQATLLYRQHANNVYGGNYPKRNLKSALINVLRHPKILKGWLGRLSESEKEFCLRAKVLAGFIDEISIPIIASKYEESIHIMSIFSILPLREKIRYIRKLRLMKNQRGPYVQFCQLIGLIF